MNDYRILDKKKDLEDILERYVELLFSKEFVESELELKSRVELLAEINEIMTTLKEINEMKISSLNQLVRSHKVNVKSSLNH